MPAKIIDGKNLALCIRSALKEKISELQKKPKLAIVFVGHDGPSEIYVRNKQKAATEIGVYTDLYTFPESVSSQTLETLIEKLNLDPSVHGILVQLPLPAHLDSDKILNGIDPQKDVDGFHPCNVGLMQKGQETGLCPATPKAILRLINEVGISLEGKNALVIGRSNIVGKPTAMLLLNQDCTVTVAHSKTKNLQDICRQADVVVSATGCSKLVKADWLKEGVVLIDVGICRDSAGKLCGDVDFDSCKDKASFITPVPGGVGPMTIAMLLENVLTAYLKQQK